MRNVSIHNLFRNQTGGFEPKGWQPEPQVRGTWSILSSCLITMLLCVWTAVHLNVPRHSGSISQSARKVGWLLLGLVAPEMIAFTAWNQYREAVKLTRDMREVLGQDPPSSFRQKLRNVFRTLTKETKKFFSALVDWPKQALEMFRGSRSYLVPSRIWRSMEEMEMDQSDVDKLIRTYGLDESPQFVLHPGTPPPRVGSTYIPYSRAPVVEPPVELTEKRRNWTMIHSLYTVMGGFSFSSEGLPINFLRDGAQRATVTPAALLILAKWQVDTIPNIGVEYIKDKSKADGLKKLIVCLQAGRFLVSTIYRMATGYPIALLELTTVAHCMYALLVYLFWWSKPLDVSEPTLIPARLCPELAALLSMASKGYRGAEAELTDVQIDRASKSILDLAGADWDLRIREVYERHRLPRLLRQRAYLSENYIILHCEDTIFGITFQHTPADLILFSHSILLSRADVERWRLASIAVVRFVDDTGDSCLNQVHPPNDERFKESLLADRARNWPSAFMRKWSSMRAKDFILFWGPFILAGLSYGGIHLLAWYAPLRHPVEVKLWIISGISISAAAPVVPVILLLLRIHDYVYNHFFPEWLQGWIDDLFDLVLDRGIFVFFGLCGLLYLIARLFLIVECFINLFYVDVHVFSVPKWTQYVPSLQ